jgi:hypothetical protein
MIVERDYLDKIDINKVEKKAQVQKLEIIAAGESSAIFSGLNVNDASENKIAIKVYKSPNRPPNILTHLVGRKMDHII